MAGQRQPDYSDFTNDITRASMKAVLRYKEMSGLSYRHVLC